MKPQAIALSILASTGLGTPLRRDVNQALYTLRLTSPAPSLNGLYLTHNPNSTTLTVSPTSSKNNRILFYPVHNPSTGLSELHTPSTGDTLAVIGANGLLDFASLENPAAVTLPEGTTLDWTSFKLSKGQGHGQKGGEVEYAGDGSEGRWVVFPASDSQEGWNVKWKNVNAWTTTDYMPVQVVYELVKDV